MKYLVFALVSRTSDKIYSPGQPWRKYIVTHGPYKRKKNAKRIAARMRKGRVIADCGQGYKDYGPTYTRVWIEEVEE